MRAESEPETRKSKTQAIKWSRDLLAPLSSSVAESGDQMKQEGGVGEKRKQEGISEGSDQQEFHSRFPVE